jgi:hypothetical protein
MNNVKLTQKEKVGRGKQGEADNGGGEVSDQEIVIQQHAVLKLNISYSSRL